MFFSLFVCFLVCGELGVCQPCWDIEEGARLKSLGTIALVETKTNEPKFILYLSLTASCEAACGGLAGQKWRTLNLTSSV